MSYNSAKHHEGFKKQHNSFSKALFKILQTKLNMFAMETKAVLQNKSDRDKKQVSVKALLPDHAKRKLITPLSEGSELNQQTIHTAFQAFWDSCFYWKNGALGTTHTH